MTIITISHITRGVEHGPTKLNQRALSATFGPRWRAATGYVLPRASSHGSGDRL